MQSKTARRFLLSLTLLLATTPLAVPAWAQAEGNFPSGTLTLERDPNDPSTLLSRYLRLLSTDPRNLSALIGAGQAALAMGDANAGIGFLGRAEEVAPRDGRVKAGLAAAAVQQEQPKQALQLFDAAIAAGIPVSAIGADRGLAYDLRGQTRLAQADYRAALAVKKDDETTRRLALSTAIGGDRAAAMAILDPLLRRQDKAAWRAATFVLAMTGDPAGAIRRANQLMIPTQAAAMTPYLQRLGSLTAAEKAAAVHFGRFPAVRPAGTQLAAVAPRRVPVPPAATNSAADLNRAAARGGAPVATTVAAPTPAPVATPVPTTAPATDSAASLNRAVAATTVPAPAPISAPASNPARLATATPTVVGATGPMMPAGERTAMMMPAAATAPAQTVTAPVASARPPVAESLPADTVRMVTAGPAARPVSGSPSTPAAARAPAPTPAVATAIPPMVVAKPVVRPAATAARTGAAPTSLVDPGPVLTRAEKAKLGLRTAGDVRVASLTRTQKARLAAVDTDAVPTLSSAEKTALGIKTKGDVSVASLTKVQKAKLAALDTDAATVLTPAEKTALGIKTKGDVSVASLTKVQKAKLAALDTDAAPVLTAAEKRALGIKTRGDVSVASLTKVQKAKLADAGKGGRAATAKAAAKLPERHWVQVAGGANKATLPQAWGVVKAKYPALLNGRTPYTTPLRATNRLLVGPFKSDDEAQAFVNKASGAGMNAFTYTSPAGTVVETVASR